MRVVEDIPQNGDSHNRRIRHSSKPPKNSLVFFNLQISQNAQADEQARYCAAQVGRISNVLVDILDVPVVDGRTNVRSHDDHEDQHLNRWIRHFSPVL